MEADGKTRQMGYAPYLDYRPLTEDEPGWQDILTRPELIEKRGQPFRIDSPRKSLTGTAAPKN